jgi:hypothetical protein
MIITRIIILVALIAISFAVGFACDGGENDQPTSVPTAVIELTPTSQPTLQQIPLPTAVFSCEQARDFIQEALISYHDKHGEWPTVDGLPGDIEWAKLVPEFIMGLPTNDTKCDWQVNSDPEGDVCLQHKC